MFRKNTNHQAFSLIELMVVVTILAFLVASGMPSYLKYLQRATVTETVSMLAEYKTALGIFWSVEQRLPTTGDILTSTPANLPFGTTVTNTTATPLPTTIQSLTLTASGNGVLVTAIIQGGVFSTIPAPNRTLVLGALPFGNEVQFNCGNFTTDATLASDIGFTDITVLPNGCNFNGVGAWLNT